MNECQDTRNEKPSILTRKRGVGVLLIKLNDVKT